MKKAKSIILLNRYMMNLLNTDPLLNKVCLIGEVTSLSYSNGNAYFTLKDQTAEIRAVMFENALRFDGMCLKPGNVIVVLGTLGVYPVKGLLQIYVKRAKARGLGDVYLKFLSTKGKLEKEGLFDKAHKKPIPIKPQAIGIITSKDGDAINDIKAALRHRMPKAKIVLYSALVQGKESTVSLIEAVKKANTENVVDTLIIARGGGNYENLISFNSEALARAIYESHIPIISGVGHEADFTICDFVCDARGATPTMAAIIATPTPMSNLKIKKGIKNANNL